MPPPKKNIVTTIESHPSLFRFDYRELWGYRYLIGLFVYRDFVVHYKQTILGPLWWLLQPLLTTIVFTVVFSKIAKIPTDSIPAPLFYLAGVTLWNYFATCLTHTAQSFLDNKDIYRKVYFHRLVIPIAAVLSNVMRYVLQMSLFVLMFFYYFVIQGTAVRPSWMIVLTPLLVLYVAFFAFGFGLLIASLTTKYRDLALTLPFLLQLWMFGSLVIFPFSMVPAKWQFVIALNPMVPPIELFRFFCFGIGGVPWYSIASGLLMTGVVFLLGAIAFNHIEKTFTDTI